VKAGTIVGAPATCQANVELYIETDATAGQQLFICNGTRELAGRLVMVEGLAAVLQRADSFITVSHDADLTGERTLKGTANHITVTDGGANGDFTLDTGANVTLSGALSNNTIPKANAAAGLVNSSITDDATTVTLPELAVISPIFNNVATLFTGLTENVTDTASQRNSLLS
jgi:hypothetical protein